MKRLLPTLATVAFLIYPSISFSSYLIELKNGRRFITYQYWEEGREIRFSLYGGVVGVGKDYVKGIRESDVAYREEILPVEEPEPVPVKAGPKADAKTETAAAPQEEKKDDERFMSEFDLLKEKSEDVNTMTNKELYEFAGDLIGWRNKILKERLGHLYSDQFIEIYEMADAVEEILTARGG